MSKKCCLGRQPTRFCDTTNINVSTHRHLLQAGCFFKSIRTTVTGSSLTYLYIHVKLKKLTRWSCDMKTWWWSAAVFRSHRFWPFNSPGPSRWFPQTLSHHLGDHPVPRRHYIYPSVTCMRSDFNCVRKFQTASPKSRDYSWLSRSQPVAVGQSAPSENLERAPFWTDKTPTTRLKITSLAS